MENHTRLTDSLVSFDSEGDKELEEGEIASDEESFVQDSIPGLRGEGQR